MKKQKNIDSICFHASFWPALGLVTLSVVIAIVLFLYQLDSIRDRERHRHELISELFIKSGNADIIIGNEHALYVMLQEYKDKYQLDDIRIEAYQAESNAPKLSWSGVIKSAWSIPGITPTQYVTIQSKISNKDLLTPSISSFSIIALFVITSLIMFKRIKRKLNEQIIIPLGQTLKSDGNDLEWFNQDKAAAEISALYQRTHQFIKELHEQRDVIEANNIKQAKYDVALQMAHDIRSPVLALETVSKMFDGLADEAKVMIHHVTNRIAQIANDVLEEHQPTSKFIINKKLGMDNILSIFEEKKRACKNENILFKLEINGDYSNVFINISDSDFNRIISNMIDNSVQAIYCTGSVLLKIDLFENNIILSIQDTGHGISTNNLNKVFEKGFTLNKKNGKGLGLSFVKEVVERHFGTINIQSNSTGTRVVLTIPCVFI